ncbi:MAG: hypothetical protein ACKO2Z_27905, partial [Sphaerospermopsis kisseleviana]
LLLTASCLLPPMKFLRVKTSFWTSRCMSLLPSCHNSRFMAQISADDVVLAGVGLVASDCFLKNRTYARLDSKPDSDVGVIHELPLLSFCFA